MTHPCRHLTCRQGMLDVPAPIVPVARQVRRGVRMEDPRPATDRPGKEPLAPIPEPLPAPPDPQWRATVVRTVIQRGL